MYKVELEFCTFELFKAQTRYNLQPGIFFNVEDWSIISTRKNVFRRQTQQKKVKSMLHSEI